MLFKFFLIIMWAVPHGFTTEIEPLTHEQVKAFRANPIIKEEIAKYNNTYVAISTLEFIGDSLNNLNNLNEEVLFALTELVQTANSKSGVLEYLTAAGLAIPLGRGFDLGVVKPKNPISIGEHNNYAKALTNIGNHISANSQEIKRQHLHSTEIDVNALDEHATNIDKLLRSNNQRDAIIFKLEPRQEKLNMISSVTTTKQTGINTGSSYCYDRMPEGNGSMTQVIKRIDEKFQELKDVNSYIQHAQSQQIHPDTQKFKEAFLSKWFYKEDVRDALVMPIKKIRDEALPIFYGVEVGQIINGNKDARNMLIDNFLFGKKLSINEGYEQAYGHTFPLFFKYNQEQYSNNNILMALLEGGGVFWKEKVNNKENFNFNKTRVKEILQIIKDAENQNGKLIFIPGASSADGGSGHWYSFNVEIVSPKNIVISVFHTGAYESDTTNAKGIHKRMEELTKFLQNNGYTVKNLSETGTRMQSTNEACGTALMLLYQQFFNGTIKNLEKINDAKNIGNGKERNEKWSIDDNKALFHEFSIKQEQEVVNKVIDQALEEIYRKPRII